MNANNITARGALTLTLGLILAAIAGCGHTSPKITTPVTEVQAPLTRTPSRPVVDSAEKRLQDRIDLMQEQIKTVGARAESMVRFHGSQMGPKWIEKVQAARSDSSRESERMRYLEATQALLARKLQALRTELKVYEEFELSDPTIPRL